MKAVLFIAIAIVCAVNAFKYETGEPVHLAPKQELAERSEVQEVQWAIYSFGPISWSGFEGDTYLRLSFTDERGNSEDFTVRNDDGFFKFPVAGLYPGSVILNIEGLQSGLSASRKITILPPNIQKLMSL